MSDCRLQISDCGLGRLQATRLAWYYIVRSAIWVALVDFVDFAEDSGAGGPIGSMGLPFEGADPHGVALLWSVGSEASLSSRWASSRCCRRAAAQVLAAACVGTTVTMAAGSALRSSVQERRHPAIRKSPPKSARRKTAPSASCSATIVPGTPSRKSPGFQALRSSRGASSHRARSSTLCRRGTSLPRVPTLRRPSCRRSSLRSSILKCPAWNCVSPLSLCERSACFRGAKADYVAQHLERLSRRSNNRTEMPGFWARQKPLFGAVSQTKAVWPLRSPASPAF